MAATPEHVLQFNRELARLDDIGLTPVALCGAGQFVESLAPAASGLARHIVGIVDDDPAKQGKRHAGFEVISAGAAVERGVRAVMLTAEGEPQDKMFANRQRFLKAGMRVVPIPARWTRRHWDACLGDFYDTTIASANGRPRHYKYPAYPVPNAVAPRGIVDAIAKYTKPGCTMAEIGPGYGLVSEHFIERAGLYHAVDFSGAVLYDMFEHRFGRHIEKIRTHLDASARMPDIPDASVDVLFSFDVFVHINTDVVYQFAKTFKRVLSNKGVALIHVMDWDDFSISQWEEYFAKVTIGYESVMRYHSMDQLRATARAVGLKVDLETDSACHGYVARFSA